MRYLPTLLLSLAALTGTVRPADAASSDLSVVPLWDAETIEPLMNRFGGQPLTYNLNLSRTTSIRYSGEAGYRLDTQGTIASNGFGFVQAPLAAYGATGDNAMGRDLNGYESIDFAFRNDTGNPFTLEFEIKDVRDGGGHIARYPITMSGASGWQQISIPLDLTTNGWTLTGIPTIDVSAFLDRTKSVGMVVRPDQGASVNGSLYFDQMVLQEPGGPVDLATAPTRVLAERLAKRQWDALWGSRNRANGLLPLHSTNASHGAINVTSAVVLMLPRAVDNGWVSPSDADSYMATLASSFHRIMDDATYTPGRYFNWVTLANDLVAEETNIDTAFLALAMHRYSSRPSTPASLRQTLDNLRNRFNFAAFSDTEGSTRGWSLAYNTNTEQMLEGTYNGYSGENWLISLAAHLNDDHHVDITEQYHSGIYRTQDWLVDEERAHLVSTFEANRPPFVQWLMPLFVDASDRGNDTFPIASLASNPNRNAELYQQEVDAYLASIGREFFLQPDAGADTSDGPYAQYSAYDHHGYPTTFMPWSAAFSLLGDEEAGAAAIRFLLEHDLEGPFGLSDSARWTTGAQSPSEVRGFADLWNTALSTAALFEFLWSDASAYADLQEVSSALDKVFYPLIPGDFTRDDVVDAQDIDRLAAQLGLSTTASALMYDLNGNGIIDADDHHLLVLDLVDTRAGNGSGTLFGDANLDGSVDLLDLSLLAQSFNTDGGWSQGDANGDGRVDLLDLSLLAQSFGQHVNVPTPTSWMLLLPGLCVALTRRNPSK